MGLALPRVQQVRGLGRQQRLQAADQCKHRHVLKPGAAKHGREVGPHHRLQQVIGNLDQILRPDRVDVVMPRVQVLMRQVKVATQRDRQHHHQHRRGNHPHIAVFDQGQAEQQQQADAADESHLGV